MHTIAIDAMGGDNAPQATVLGTLRAVEKRDDIVCILIGKREEIEPHLGDKRAHERIRVIDAREVITNHESPVMALRKKPDASLSVALKMVRDGEASALVSAGSTGAVMAGALFRLERLPYVERPALAVPIPTLNGVSLLVDSGANVDVSPDILVKFAAMGSVFAKHTLGKANPTVALINIGEESEKGNALTKEAYKLLSASGQPFNFIGNIEARGVPMGEADIMVCDGFTGNIILKSIEGVSKALFTKIKQSLSSSAMGKLGGLFAQSSFRKIRKEMSADEVGGALLLGASAVVVKAHGNSNEYAFSQAISQAYNAVKGDVITKIRESLTILEGH
ncbi:phosphate acyltransferase [Clostridia bacterium]|nr:phosphate acyltransferase [Clostridia bacterium]